MLIFGFIGFRLLRAEYCNFRKFYGKLIFVKSDKRHICDVKNSRLGHDLPVSVKDRVILPFCDGLIFTKLRICEVS